MPLTITVTASHGFPAGQPVTLPALRKAALPSVSMAGSVATGDLVDGSVTPAKVSVGAFWYGAAVLGGSTYALTLTPALTGLANGVLVRFRVDVGSPAGGVLLDVNGLGARPIVKNKGLRLGEGDLKANQECLVSYDATAAVWQLQNELANHGDRYGTSTGAANAYVLTFDDTTVAKVVSLASISGIPIRFKVSFTNTGAATLAIDGLAAKGIKLWDNQALPNGYLKVNEVAEVIYDSGLDVFLIPNPAKDTGIGGAIRNLVLKAAATSGTDDDLTVTADDCVVKDAAGNVYGTGAVSATLNPTTTGVNAFDTGAPASGSWYYVWVIWDGTNVRVLGSASNTAPTMPTGYTHKALVGEWLFETVTNPRGTISYGERKVFTLVGGTALPAGDVLANFAHRLGMVPRWTRVSVVCTTGEFNYSVGDEIPAEFLINDTNSGDAVHVQVDGTNVGIVIALAYGGGGVRSVNKSTFAMVTLTKASWRYKVVAST